MQPIAAPAVLPVAIAVCDPGSTGIPPAPAGGQPAADAASGEAGVFALLLPTAPPATAPMPADPDTSAAQPIAVDLTALLASQKDAASTDDGQGTDAELLALLASLTQVAPTTPPSALAPAQPTETATAVEGAPATADAAYDALMTQLATWTSQAAPADTLMPDLGRSLAAPTVPTTATATTAPATWAAAGPAAPSADAVPPTIALPIPAPRRPGDAAMASVPIAEATSAAGDVDDAAATTVPAFSAPAAVGAAAPAAPAAPADRLPLATPTGSSETAPADAILTTIPVAAPTPAASVPVSEAGQPADVAPAIRHASAPAPPPRPSAGPSAAPPAAAPDKSDAPAEPTANADPGTPTATGNPHSAQPPARIEQPAPAERATPIPQPRSEANQLDRAVAQQVSRAIVQHLPDGGTRMVMRLTPPELGTVRIEFLTHDGATTARLMAEDEGVRQSLDRALPHIRADLRSEHPSLNITVERGEHNQHWSDGNARQDRRDQPHPGRQGPSGADAPVFAIDGIEPTPAPIPVRSERSLGGRLTSTSVDALA